MKTQMTGEGVLEKYVGVLKSYAIAGAIALSTLLPQQARADSYVPLPEPRYVQEKVDYKTAGGKQFAVPVIKDAWTELLEQKAQKLEDIVYMGCGGWHESLCARSCDHFKVSSTAINCEDDVKVCIKWETETPSINLCNTMRGDDCSSKRVCTGGYRTHRESVFYAPYSELYDIRQCGGWGLDSDNVCFRRGGKDYDFDTQDSGTAARAAELMRELKSISLQIARDGRSHHTKEEAKQAQWDYERAFLYQHRLEIAINCVQNTRGKLTSCARGALWAQDMRNSYVSLSSQGDFSISDIVSEKTVPLHYKKWKECYRYDNNRFQECLKSVFGSGPTSPTKKEIRAALHEKLKKNRALLRQLR